LVVDVTLHAGVVLKLWRLSDSLDGVVLPLSHGS
jgi:hypothetical protein